MAHYRYQKWWDGFVSGMGIGLRAISRRNLFAIGLGGVLLGACLLGFDFWLGRMIDREGQVEADTSARRAIALSDSRLAQVIEELDKVASLGVGSCSLTDMVAMRHAAFNSTPVKEVSVVSPTGETLCTHLGLPLGVRHLVSSEPFPGSEGYTLDIFDFEESQRMVRLRRPAINVANSVAALVPSSLLIPLVSPDGSVFTSYAQVATQFGATIRTLGERPEGDLFDAKAVSNKTGFVAEIAKPRASVLASHADLRTFGIAIWVVFALSLGGVTVLMRSNPPPNPVAELEDAISAGEFVPYYQPVVDIRSGQLRGAEVLMRWRKPDGTLVLPGAFIPLAESSGLIRYMTRDMMRRVCAEIGPALSRRPGLKVSFNFSGKLLSDESIVKDVRNIFAGSPIRMSQVVIELTERDPIENFTLTRQIIAALQGLGVRIAIDDVGTGHSGLSYMLKLGVDIIKIDKMFVDAIGSDRNSTTIVETLVDLAHNMRMDVVAEGVENFDQVKHLRELGIRAAQGYVFAPPLPGSSFLQLVDAMDPPVTAQPASMLTGSAAPISVSRSAAA